jgi:hypothetical protein
MWVSNSGGMVSFKSLRRVFASYYDALRAMPDALVGRPASGDASVRIVTVIYRRHRRTAEQERADVVAWLRTEGHLFQHGRGACLMAQEISAGAHVGKGDAK